MQPWRKTQLRKYWFSDGTDQILVAPEPEDFLACEFDENDVIEIDGEVEKRRSGITRDRCGIHHHQKSKLKL